jgi:hypothetical protein
LKRAVYNIVLLECVIHFRPIIVSLPKFFCVFEVKVVEYLVSTVVI